MGVKRKMIKGENKGEKTETWRERQRQRQRTVGRQDKL